MSEQPTPFQMHAEPVSEAPKRKGVSNRWIIGGAIVLAATGAFLYKHSGQLSQAESMLDPTPARHQVPVDKAMEAPPSQAAKPAASAATGVGSDLVPNAPAGSTLDPVTSMQNGGVTPTASVDNTQVLDRLTKIEDAIQALSTAIAKLSSEFAAWVAAGHPSPDSQALSKQDSAEVVAPRKRVRRQSAAKPPVKADKPEQSAARPSAELSPEVLAIDTWNGKPSVAVRNASGVQFLSEGDQAGSYTLKRADNDGQRAVFADPAGAMTVQQRSNR